MNDLRAQAAAHIVTMYQTDTSGRQIATLICRIQRFGEQSVLAPSATPEQPSTVRGPAVSRSVKALLVPARSAAS